MSVAAIQTCWEGGPMRGLELTMRPQGQCEALKKNAPDGTNKHTHRRTQRLNQWGRFSENGHLDWLDIGTDSVKMNLQIGEFGQKSMQQYRKIGGLKEIVNKVYVCFPLLHSEPCYNLKYFLPNILAVTIFLVT